MDATATTDGWPFFPSPSVCMHTEEIQMEIYACVGIMHMRMYVCIVAIGLLLCFTVLYNYYI